MTLYTQRATANGPTMLRPDAPALPPERPDIDALDARDRLFGVTPPARTAAPRVADPNPALPLPARKHFVPMAVGYSFRLPPLVFRFVGHAFTSSLDERRVHSFVEVIGAVCQCFHVTRQQLLAHRRFKPVAEARQALYLLLHEHTLWSLPDIGRQVGGRDHATVHYGIRKALKRAERGGLFAEQLALAQSMLARKEARP